MSCVPIISVLYDITKEDAITIIGETYNKDSCLIPKFLPESLRLDSGEDSQKILYSYNDVPEVPGIAQDSVMGLNTESVEDFIINETTDYYTVVSVDHSKVACGEQTVFSCDRGISFNKKYLDYHEGTEDYVHGEDMIFNDLSTDFIEFVLKIIAKTYIWDGFSLYDYYLEDAGDSFVFTGIYFGVGMDLEKLEGVSSTFDIPYAINIYEKEITLDKTTRKPYYGENTPVNYLRSISLSDDDMSKIQAAIYNLTDN